MASQVLIKRFTNFPVSSNCFVLTCLESYECVLVDPACGKGEMLDEYCSVNKLRPVYIILTHEHFDHIGSVEYLKDIYDCKVVASVTCSERIGNPKKNLSAFYDQQGFSCKPADIIVENDGFPLPWNGKTLHFHLTPGHTEGGICFSIEDNLFTGDTIMNGYKPVVKLPGGNKIKLQASISRLLALYNEDTTVFPGHGEIFKLKDRNSCISE